MRHKLVISNYNRDAYRLVVDRARPGPHTPLLISGPSGLGKSLLLDALEKRTRRMADTSLVRLTSEEWMNRLRSKESPSLGSDASLVLIDNLEILTGKNATQAYLAKSITGSEGSVVMVTNTDPEDLRQLVGAIGPQVVRLSPPSGAELRRMACLLLESHCTDENLDLYEKPSNPGELMGLIAQISAERTLLPA